MRGFSGGIFAGPGGRLQRRRRAPVAAAAPLTLLGAFGARADEALRGFDPPASASAGLISGPAAVIGLAVLLIAAATAALLHWAARRAWARRISAMEAKLANASVRVDRAALIVRSEPQIVIAWDRPDAEPSIEGDFSIVSDAPAPRRVLSFAAWLEPEAAAKAEEAVERLLSRGEAFCLPSASLRGRHLEIVGRPVSGSAVVRIREVSGDRLEAARMRDKLAETEASVKAARLAHEQAAILAWSRNEDGRMDWCNAAYARAVEVAGENAAVDQSAELFDPGLRREAAAALRETGVWKRRASAVVAGERRTFEVAEVKTPFGSSGVAYDVSEAAALKAEMERNEDDYSRMIDRLSTAVAIFDKSKRLTFYNAAYAQMWSLEPAFLDSHPTDGEVLDRLRTKRQLPEQADFRTWKAQLMEAYQAIEFERNGLVPAGRTGAARRHQPQSEGRGDLSLRRRHAELRARLASHGAHPRPGRDARRAQGRRRGFRRRRADEAVQSGIRRDVGPRSGAPFRPSPYRRDRARLPGVCQEPALWDRLRGMVVGLHDHRETLAVRIDRVDDLTLDCAALPLPDGATLLTFLDVTASASVERALTDRNEALVAAEKLRNDFVNHVSYELRTPLTNIIGFTQLLAAGGVGPLNPKQLEYAGFITNSSHALLAIIDDILDLASIDAGALELRLEPVDVAEAMRAAAAGVQDRLDEASIELRMVITDGVGAFAADGRRVRQVLFNLLSNAINYSESGQTVTLAAMRRMDEIVFKVSDRGRGIPPEMIDKVFDRFETFPNGSRHRGPGLGLSIVKAMVELHGGRVLIDTAPGEGTTITCIFPVEPAAAGAGSEDARASALTKPKMAR